MRPALTPGLLMAAILALLPARSEAEEADPTASGKAVAEERAPSKEELAEARRLAREERARERERERRERERLCVIKPVMTDAEKALCREVWR